MLADIISHMEGHRYICPIPQSWQHVYSLLPGKKRVAAGFDPPVPLILGAWGHTNDQEKRQRFQIHLEYAVKNNVVNDVCDYLAGLSAGEWLHEEK